MFEFERPSCLVCPSSIPITHYASPSLAPRKVTPQSSNTFEEVLYEVLYGFLHLLYGFLEV